MKRMTGKQMVARALAWLVAAVCVMTGLSACSEKDNPSDVSFGDELVGAWFAEADWFGTIEDVETPFTKTVQGYEFRADGTGTWHKVYVTAGYDILHSLTTDFHYFVSSDGWIRVKLDDTNGTPAEWNLTMQDGQLKLEDDTPDMNVTTEDDEPLLMLSPATRSQIDFTKGFLTEDLRFLANWENCETVRVNGLDNPVATPWNSESQSAIPYSVSKQVKRSQGWEMAFCSLNNTATPDIRYFGLYNKWTGTLRVFHYIINPTGYGNEIDYQVWMGRDQMSANEVPFYNSMEYGIPASHQPGTTLRDDVQLFGTSRQSHPFMTWVSPYRIYEQALISGWYCFDLDMSGYVPEGQQWRDVQDDVKLMIVPQFRNNQNITLMGSLIGDINGTQAPERIVQNGGGNMFSGVCGVLNMISGKASSSITTGNAYVSLMKNSESALGQFLNPIKYWGGFGCSITSTALNMMGKMLEDPVSYDTIPGKIDMKLNAQMDLAGTITNFVSANQPIFRVTLANIERSNGEKGHFGRGVWSLAEDPVVYVDKEDIMGDDGSDFLNLYYYSPNTYSNLGNNKDCKFRLVWFLDPASVKVNINRELFPDIKNVTVTTLCGIYTDRKYGYTSAYRKFMTLGNLPTFPLSENINKAITASTPRPKLVKVTADGLLNYEGADTYETKANATTIEIPGYERYAITAVEAVSHKPTDSVRVGMRAYGRVINEFDKKIMVSPQLFVPYGGNSFQDPVVPDLVVSVDVTFEACGSTFHFTKCFIPQIKLIGRQEAGEHYRRLLAFAAKSRAQEPTGTLANDGNTSVYSPDAHVLMGKTLHMLSLLSPSTGPVTVIRATEGHYDNASASNLFDNDASTPWYVKRADMQGDVWFVEFKYDRAFVPTSYVLRTRSQWGVDTRYPKSWKLMAKANSSDSQWTVLSSDRDNMSIKGYQESYQFKLSNVKDSYQYYRFEVSQNRGDDIMQLGDLEIYE